MSDGMRIWVDRHGHPCDSDRHDAQPLEVVPAAAYNCLRHGLTAICTAGDAAPFTDAYREAGGGYEGLQAIARTALEMADRFEIHA